MAKMSFVTLLFTLVTFSLLQDFAHGAHSQRLTTGWRAAGMVKRQASIADMMQARSSAQGTPQVCSLMMFPPSQLPLAVSTVSASYSAAGSNDLYGYLLIFFRDDTEQINAGLSVGNDALNYTLYNNGTKPILTSAVGSKHTRDPFLVRSPDKSKNWIIATDNSLAAFKGDFDRAQRVASRSITIYESVGASLTKWKPARLSAPLAGPWSGGVQAPEAYWDEGCGKYFVIFGSNRFADDDVNHKGNLTLSQIYYVLTDDFFTFTEPTLYYSIPNGGLSDMTIAPTGLPGQYVRFFRDDTNGTLSIRGQTTNGGLFGAWTDIGKDGKKFVSSNDGPNGGPLLFPDNLDKSHWHIWIDRFTGAYKPFETDDVTGYGYTVSNAPSFPKDLKQGSVTPLTCEEYNDLRTATFTTASGY